ncbi:MAG: ATP-grasp domain-containing protein [Candidatus Nitrohelix vancouverensis]|uniref:ATP-grasp domain-containing protein n=1 Tax=Candidatus Nitrohelix vancouverensis TaxID=2705534 RepID=A0A7T0C3M5_9BACT|nr:MAG: ATP-grasp domain-containing protein [Candidatus Nitrohelix vancouverensis]
MKILLITGPAGPTQGWGDMATTDRIHQALIASGFEASVAFITSHEEFLSAIHKESFDLVWSALYHLDQDASRVGIGGGELWLADYMEQVGIPFVGSSAQCMRTMIDKAATHKVLEDAGIPVPWQVSSDETDLDSLKDFPAFVKPRFESESAGITEASVSQNTGQMTSRARYIEDNFNQPALIEEYLPGTEWTVSVLGNGNSRQLFPVVNNVNPARFKQYPVIREDLKGNDAIVLSASSNEIQAKQASLLANRSVEALGCLDHVRVDLKEDKDGRLKVIEVNGIPGLNPIKSRSLRIHSLCHSSLTLEENFEILIASIVSSALDRCGFPQAAS